jgi:hypothetical protein
VSLCQGLPPTAQSVKYTDPVSVNLKCSAMNSDRLGYEMDV